MHIADGILPGPVIAATSALAVGGVGLGLSRLDYEQIPRVGMLSAAFFVVSLIHVKLGPASAHLLLTGLIGCLLGWKAMPALFCALLLQAALFAHGGVICLGANVLVMGLPAVACYYLIGRGIRATATVRRVFVLAFVAGAVGVCLSCAMMGAVLCAAGREFMVPVIAIFVAHVPLMVIEGFITAAALVFLRRVRPELLAPRADAGPCKE